MRYLVRLARLTGQQRHGWVQAQGFQNHRAAPVEMLHIRHGHRLVPADGCNFSQELLFDPGGVGEQVKGPGQGGGGGFVARHENCRGLVAQRGDVETIAAIARVAGDQQTDHGCGVALAFQMCRYHIVNDMMHPGDGLSHSWPAAQGPALVGAEKIAEIERIDAFLIGRESVDHLPRGLRAEGLAEDGLRDDFGGQMSHFGGQFKFRMGRKF